MLIKLTDHHSQVKSSWLKTVPLGLLTVLHTHVVHLAPCVGVSVESPEYFPLIIKPSEHFPAKRKYMINFSLPYKSYS